MDIEQSLNDYHTKLLDNIIQLKKAMTIASRLRKAAALGCIRDIDKYKLEYDSIIKALSHDAHDLSVFQFDTSSYLNSKSGFHEDLLRAANEEKLYISVSDEGKYFCYPITLTITPKESCLLIGKKKVYTLRPSHVIAFIKTMQSKKGPFNQRKLIDILYKCHSLAGKQICSTGNFGAYSPNMNIPITDIYDILTIMPGSTKEYSAFDFAKDIHELTNNQSILTSDGHRLKCREASAGSRGKTKSITLVTKDGHEMRYTYLSFVKHTDQ